MVSEKKHRSYINVYFHFFFFFLDIQKVKILILLGFDFTSKIVVNIENGEEEIFGKFKDDLCNIRNWILL